MDLTLAHIKLGRQIYKRSRSKTHYKKYDGQAREIARSIVHDCWNGRFFQVSANGHSDFFSLRIFSFCCSGIIKIGFKHEVIQNIEWIIAIYKQWNRITTTITNDEKPINIFNPSPDSLPLLLRAIRTTNTKFIVNEHIDFFNKNIREYYNYFVDHEKGLIKKELKLSSLKSHSERTSSIYDNCMIALLSDEIEKFRTLGVKMVNPFRKLNYKKIIKDRFWAGTHFLDDLTLDDHIGADANIIPFYLGLYTNTEMIWSAVTTMQKYNLDKPFPMKYTTKKIEKREIFPLNMLAPNFHGSTCHSLLGLLFTYVVRKISPDLLDHYVDVFAEQIEKNKNLLEVFDDNSKPYKSKFYKSDESMLYAAMFIELLDFYHEI